MPAPTYLIKLALFGRFPYLLDASVQVDGPAGVLHVVAGVVDVDAVVLVRHVTLQLVPGIPTQRVFFENYYLPKFFRGEGKFGHQAFLKLLYLQPYSVEKS